MSISDAGAWSVPYRAARANVKDDNEQTQIAGLRDELDSVLAREQVLLREKIELSQRQAMLAQEFEHRLLNSLQLIASLLSLQSRAAATPEAAAQLTGAAHRVGALGRVHRQLHLLDHAESVEFKPYLHHLCEELSALFFQAQAGPAIVVEGANVQIPSALAIPLGFIVNELVTNSAKYANGNITVRLQTTPLAGHSLSVSDDGPGLPPDFDAGSTKRLGMRIVRALVQQIGGELQIAAGDDGRGSRFTVSFGSPQSNTGHAAVLRVKLRSSHSTPPRRKVASLAHAAVWQPIWPEIKEAAN